jgi:RNA polymerase sigma-32 factor
MAATTMPVVRDDGNLGRYFQEIRKFPILAAEQELALARRWSQHGDLEAAHTLVTSHLRLVAKIAMGYRGYGLPLNELISEGNVGMMQAAMRFDPERGFRLATYAVWWIRAAMQQYVLHNWSMVKMGTTAAQKKLFFNLRKVKGQLRAIEEGDLSPENLRRIATELDVPEAEVIAMNRRLVSPDHSLNAPMSRDGDGEWLDALPDECDDQETRLADGEERVRRNRLLNDALCRLSERERHIVSGRHLREDPATIAELSQRHSISRERVRQIDRRALEKLRATMRSPAAIDLVAAKVAALTGVRPAPLF